MSTCYDEGRLRAYLDGELAPLAATALAAHLPTCPACRSLLAAQRASSAQVRTLLAAPPTPDPAAALQRAIRAAQPAPLIGAALAETQIRSNPMQRLTASWSHRRGLYTTLLALIMLAGLLALPPVRAAADQLLSVFRVQKVVFMPIDPARIEQLNGLDLKGDALFVGKPKMDDAQPAQQFGSAAEAGRAAGYAVQQITGLPDAQPGQFGVSGPGHAEVQLNVAALRQVLDALDIRDVTLPDALGAAPITIDTQAFVHTSYRGANYELTLHQGASPSVTLPEGVELAQLGRAALRVLGMAPAQAEIVSRQINWNNTLLFPFPADADNIHQLTINGEQALLVTGGGRRASQAMLYWQQGGQIYALEARSSGLNSEEQLDLLVRAAESVR